MNKTKPNTHKRMLVTLVAAISLWTFLIGLTKPASQTPLLGFSAVAATLEKEAAETTSATEVPEGEVLMQLLEMTSEYAANYGLTPEMTDQELAGVYLYLDSERAYSAWTELNEMVVLSEDMTAEEIRLLLEQPSAQLCDRLYAIIYQINTPVTVATIDHSPLEGIHITGSSNGESDSMSYDASAGTVTIAIKGKDGACGSGKTATATITIQNTSTSRATISFKIDDPTKVNSLTYDTGKLEGKNFSVTLAANATATLTMTTAKNNTENKVVFSNFKHEPVASNAKVTVTYDAQKGSVTLGGASVPNGGSATATEGILTAAAAPASGCSFLGWINAETGERISPDANTTLNVPQNVNIQAVFVTTASDMAWFLVDNKWLSNDLNAAAQLGKMVVLMNSGTLPASTSDDGVYTIPAGVTLLIPYDAAGTLCTDTPTTNSVNIVNDGKTPSVFRMLTMANGANITVNGAISVSGSQSSCYGYNGMPYGPLGFIDMKSGSTITVNNGANLYVWGYITGSGSVEIKSGGTVHEHFQIADFRGGDVTSKMAGKDDEYGVFPFNQYYIQNVEVPMTLHQGAVEKGRGSVSITLAGTQAISIPFIGHTSGDSMFVIQSGYIVKDYIEGTGRTEVKIYGDLSVSEVNLSMKVSLIGSLDIDSKKYVLPIPHHFTVSVESGSISMDQTMAFLPGSELYIREGATCTLGTGKKLYVYDLDQWLYNEGANGYSGTTNQPYMTVKYVPGGDGTTGRLKDALVQVDGTVDVSAGSAYVTSSGANIYSTGTGKVIVGSTKDTKTYQVTTGGSKGTDITGWPEIPVVPVILQDDDSTDVSTATAGAYTYYAATGKWCPPGHRYNDGEVIAPTCTAAGYTKYTCVACGDSYTEDLYAAQVKGINYPILNDAIAAANRSTPVTLLHDIVGDVPVDKLVSINKNGFTAEIKAEEGFVLSQDGSVVTVLIKIYATNISAGDGLDMYFYIHKNAMPDTNGYTPHITRDYADEDPQTVVAEWETYEEAPLWRFCYHDIAAKEMTDELTAVVKYDGVQVSNTHTETIKSYAIRALGSKDKEDTEVDEGAALDTALMDMLNYGAGAQTIFNYNTGELANIVYDETTEGKLSTYAGSATQENIITESNLVKGSDNNLKAVSVSAKNKLMLTFYFANITTDMTAEITYTNHNGAVKTDTVNGSEFVPYGNWLGVDVTGLAIADGRQVVTCTVKDGDKTIATASDSVEGYVHRNSGSNEVLKLLMKFVDSAYNYFHPTGDA